MVTATNAMIVLNTLTWAYQTLRSFCRASSDTDTSEETSEERRALNPNRPCKIWIDPSDFFNNDFQSDVRPTRESVVGRMRDFAFVNLSSNGMLIGSYFVAEASGLFDGYGLSIETLVDEGVFASGEFSWQDIITPIGEHIFKMNVYLDERFLHGMCFLISRGLEISPFFAIGCEQMSRFFLPRHRGPALGGIQIVSLVRHDFIGAILTLASRDAFLKGTDIIGFICAIATTEQCEKSCHEWLEIEYFTRNISQASASLATALFDHLKRKHQSETLFSILYNHTQIRNAMSVE